MESPLTAKAVLLQALATDGPAYGAKIIKRVKSMTKDKLTLHSGSVYPALTALQKEGLVTKQADAENGRACYYALTTKGKAEARRQRDLVRIVFFPSEKKWKSRKGSSSSISMAS